MARGTVSALDPPRLVEFNTDVHGRLRWGTIDWPNWSRDHMPEWERIRGRYAAPAQRIPSSRSE